MADLFWLSEAQMRRIEPYFPLSHGMPRMEDRRVLSGIVFVIRNGLRWRDAPADYGPPKTIYNRLMIDATHLKAHRTAASLLEKGLYPDVSGAPRAG
jgi:putative transposase